MWKISFVLVVMGLIIGVCGMIYAQMRHGRKRLQGRVKARVVDLILREDTERPSGQLYTNRYYPVFEYYAEGRLYKKTYSKGAYPARYKIGQEVSLDYDVKDPNRYRITVNDPTEQIPNVLMFAGGAMIALGILIFLGNADRG